MSYVCQSVCHQIDTSDRPQDAESPNMRTYPGLYSWYHPDALVTKKIGGRYVMLGGGGRPTSRWLSEAYYLYYPGPSQQAAALDHVLGRWS